VGKPMRQALPEAEEQGFITLLDRVYETGEPFVATGRSLSVARVPGQPLEEHYLDFVYQPMRETDGTISGVLVLGVDVTERKRTEAALLQSEKLAAVGRLSASIAHEINNPLEAVTNLLYLLNEEKDLPEQARALLIWRNKSWRA
jgi:nitrogen-specific signal transduction histidine kinase